MEDSLWPHIRLAAVSLDCADPVELAQFYIALLDGELLRSKDDSAGGRVGATADSGGTSGIVLVPQRVAGYAPPEWPGTSIVHMDLTAGTTAEATEQATRRAIELGATLADPQPDQRWRVLLDPAGHPFCVTPFAPN